MSVRREVRTTGRKDLIPALPENICATNPRAETLAQVCTALPNDLMVWRLP